MRFYSDGAFQASSIKESVWIAAGAMRIGRYLVLIILFVGFFILFGNRGLLDNQRLNEKLAELRADTSRLEAVDSGLRREVVLLRDDLRYIEAVARNELGMLKRGDLIYRFVDSAGKKDEPTTPPHSNGVGQPSREPDNDKPRKDAAPYPAKRNPA
jgi:cell division protein FtsB